MSRMTLIQRFSVLCLLALVAFGVLLGWVVTVSLERNMLDRSKQLVAEVVADEVRKEFAGDDLTTPKTGADYATFSDAMAHLSLGPDVERVKIWNSSGVIVWSDEESLVGQFFADNHHLRESLGGEVVSEISPLAGTEYEFERQFDRLLELYVPIRFAPQGEIEAVFEVYQNLDPLYDYISSQKGTAWPAIGAGFYLLYLVLVRIVWRASRRIEAQGKEISKSEERYRSLVQSAQDGIVSVDQNRRIVLFNSGAERIFGYSAAEALGQPYTILAPDGLGSGLGPAIRHLLRAGEPSPNGKDDELQGLRKDGQVFPLELSLSVSGKEDPTVTAIVRDISARKAMQRQLVDSEKQASVALIAGSIGHEINNVVTGLAGYSQLLMEDPADAELARKSAEVFSAQSERLQLHGKNLLELSKPREPRMEPVSVDVLLEKVTNVLCTSGLLKAYSVVRNYAESLPQVYGDETLLEQVIRNLEINAAHAMESGGTLTLDIRMSESNSHVEFSVGDSGHGIPEDQFDKVFVPFFTTKEEGRGTGLGMHIVKTIVEQHQGYIRLKSTVGVGTVVTVGLPPSPAGA